MPVDQAPKNLNKIFYQLLFLPGVVDNSGELFSGKVN